MAVAGNTPTASFLTKIGKDAISRVLDAQDAYVYFGFITYVMLLICTSL